ncbi:MAG: ArsR family transcriptional regulator [Bacteroides sp.]|nr:ArsR family transcriptional regulator [Bacteroides sp.]
MKIRINFAVSSYSYCLTFKISNMKLSKQEEELIAAIRNYRKGYPDSYPNLLFYAQQVFDELTDLPD